MLCTRNLPAMPPNTARPKSSSSTARRRISARTARPTWSLTFRNVHNWVMADTAPQCSRRSIRVLKPGGVLGITDHRAAKGADLEKIKKSGYLPEDFVIKLATDAGFKLAAKSEINANPKDTKDYPEGVWTLAADVRTEGQGSRQIRGDRRVRPHDVEVRQARADDKLFKGSGKVSATDRRRYRPLAPLDADRLQQTVQRAVPVHGSHDAAAARRSREFGLPRRTSTRPDVSITIREGLLLLTDDGALAKRLTDPRHADREDLRRAGRRRTAR